MGPGPFREFPLLATVRVMEAGDNGAIILAQSPRLLRFGLEVVARDRTCFEEADQNHWIDDLSGQLGFEER